MNSKQVRYTKTDIKFAIDKLLNIKSTNTKNIKNTRLTLSERSSDVEVIKRQSGVCIHCNETFESNFSSLHNCSI